MTRRERLEDLGKLSILLGSIADKEIFQFTHSKHDYEEWVKRNHDELEYGEPKGLDYIFRHIRRLREEIEECFFLSEGTETD